MSGFQKGEMADRLVNQSSMNGPPTVQWQGRLEFEAIHRQNGKWVPRFVETSWFVSRGDAVATLDDFVRKVSERADVRNVRRSIWIQQVEQPFVPEGEVYTVLVGDITDGVIPFGVFDSSEDAQEWASNLSETWVWTQIRETK